MGETRVDLHHLLEDLRDAYPGALEETILTEIVANSLDSGASRIRFATDPGAGTLTAVDDGAGMKRRELARYHDVAASTKTRGEGIGFAGVGIKLALLVCEEVRTESRRGATHVATRWHLATKHRAPWKWVPPPGLVEQRGTALGLDVKNRLSPLLDPGYIEGTLHRHFRALFDSAFDPILEEHYPRGIVFEVNGVAVGARELPARDLAPLAVRLPRKRKPLAMGYLFRSELPLPDEDRGLAVSTLGKIIKGGWDWLGVSPGSPERIGGLVEVPALAACLTLNKSDFVRTGVRGATYLAYRKAIQEAVARQLEAWGDTREGGVLARRRAARPLERDLERVLVDLADDFPLLSTLVENRLGGQRRLPIGRSDGLADGRSLVAMSTATSRDGDPTGQATAVEAGPEADAAPPDPASSVAGTSAVSSTDLSLPASRDPEKKGARQATRYGLTIQFESRPEHSDLGRLIEATVWVNEAHPAYRRAVASRSEGYHIALAVALALSSLAVEPAGEHRFVTSFLTRWGEALEPRRGGARDAGRARREGKKARARRLFP